MIESNRFPTVRRRLEQIEEYNLPYNRIRGDQTGKGRLIRIESLYLNGSIPEFVFGVNSLLKEYDTKLFEPKLVYNRGALVVPDRGLVTDLSLASGEIIPPDAFWFNDERNQIDYNYLECHAFFDSSTWWTHFFVLPSLSKNNEWLDHRNS